MLESECENFVTITTVVGLVVFEFVFFFLFVAPVVEQGNVQLSADTVVSSFSVPLGAITKCADVPNVQQLLLNFANTPAAAALNEKQVKTNREIRRNALLVILASFVGLAVYWYVKLRRNNIAFPWAAIASETLPIMLVFAMYDFLYFYVFVRVWGTTSAAEFALEFAKELSSDE